MKQKHHWTGVDLDHCFTEGKLNPTAAQVLNLLNSYTEYSPSGAGLHILCYAALPSNISQKEIELYDHARHFTVTARPYLAPLPIRLILNCWA